MEVSFRFDLESFHKFAGNVKTEEKDICPLLLTTLASKPQETT